MKAFLSPPDWWILLFPHTIPAAAASQQQDRELLAFA